MISDFLSIGTLQRFEKKCLIRRQQSQASEYHRSDSRKEGWVSSVTLIAMRMFSATVEGALN